MEFLFQNIVTLVAHNCMNLFFLFLLYAMNLIFLLVHCLIRQFSPKVALLSMTYIIGWEMIQTRYNSYSFHFIHGLGTVQYCFENLLLLRQRTSFRYYDYKFTCERIEEKYYPLNPGLALINLLD
jgi:hypothetical protein